MDGFDIKCGKINNIIKSFKSRDIINNYKWIIKYNTLDDGLFILGSEMQEIIPNYNSNKLLITNSITLGLTNSWGLRLQKIICGNNETINKDDKYAEIDNDFSLIKGGYIYYNYIEKNFFKEYYSKKICKINTWDYDRFKKYFVIDCEKEKFGKDDIKNFPNLGFFIHNTESILTLEGKDLFTETKYKYFFNIIFPFEMSELWVFGKIFLKKFPTNIDFDQKVIHIYNDYFEEIVENENENENKSIPTSFTLNTFWIIIIIIIGFIIFGLLCYLLGKNLNKIRKKKANELADDEYDYTPATAENNVINNIS